MGGALTTHGGKERRIQDFGGDTQLKGTSWKTQALMEVYYNGSSGSGTWGCGLD